jgi:transketolase
LLYGDGEEFRIGGHRVLRPGGDLALIACGYALHVALAAADGLQTSGISAAVVDLYSLPFEAEQLAELARASGGRVLTIEDNYGGALGAAVSEALLDAGGEIHLRRMFVQKVPKSGRSPDDVLEHLGLTAADVERVARNLLAESRAPKS